MNTLQKGILLAVTLVAMGGVWGAFSAADPAPSSLITRVEAGGNAQPEGIAPMSSLRQDWSTVPVEPTPASF